MDIVTYGLIFWTGLVTGYLLKSWLTAKFKDYSGTIVVDTDDFTEKTVYSLVLEDYPDELVFKKEVVFKIDTSAQSSKSQTKQ